MSNEEDMHKIGGKHRFLLDSMKARNEQEKEIVRKEKDSDWKGFEFTTAEEYMNQGPGESD